MTTDEEFGPDQHLLCLTRLEPPSGGWVTHRSLCYQTMKPVPPPSSPPALPKPVEYSEPRMAFDGVTGELTTHLLACYPYFFNLLALEVELSLFLDKGGGAASGSMIFTADTTAPFVCDDGMQGIGPATLTPLAQSHDEDGDGCADWEELGDSQTSGGLRDPFNFWDYFDTPDPNATPQRDKMIRTNDIYRVIDRYGTDDDDGQAPINRYTDPLSTPPKTGYHPAFDRGAEPLGPELWNLGPADGMIRVQDITHVTNQYGHDCVDPP